MANSDFLRKNTNQHSVKNSISKKMEHEIDLATGKLLVLLKNKYQGLKFLHRKNLPVIEIIEILSSRFPQFKNDFTKSMDSSFIKPDGGFIFATDGNGVSKLILVTEVKRQGTNDKRAAEGLKKQARGNAIERLGKNLIGIRAIFKSEKILPFVCFGSGHDFKPGSTILDRVITMNDFFSLNKIFVEKKYSPFEPSSMFFRYERWKAEDMLPIIKTVAEESIKHYFGASIF